MAQMIDPKTAREHIQANYPNDPLLRTIAMTLVEGLPKVEVEEEQKWIPVTERLPDKDGKYLVMGKFPREMPQIWICDFITFGFVRGWSNPARNPMVKAWMPLPEPPKEE